MATSWQDRHRVILAVFLLFRKDGKVLLQRRAGTGYMDGWYGLPSGHVDGDEAAIMAACREAKEEVGVDIQPEDLQLGHTVHELAEGHERLNLGFEVLRYKGKITNVEPEKCDELRWSLLEDLPENTVPSVRDMLERIRRGEKYSSFNFEVPEA